MISYELRWPFGFLLSPQIFDRGRSDVYSHLCRSDALHKLLNISNKGTTSLPVQLCNLAEPEAFLFTSNVVRNLNWTALLTEMAGITKQSGYDIGLEDWRKALVIAQQVRKEVGELSSLREMLDSLFKKVRPYRNKQSSIEYGV